MLTASLMLLLVSAVVHATAQSMIKGARDKLAFAWLMLGFASLAGLPLLAGIGRIEARGWVFVAASGTIEAFYYASLTKAYSLGDFSVVYPVSRGSAPLFTLAWSVFFLGERPSLSGVFGILLVVCGIYLVNLRSLSEWRRPFSEMKSGATPWAIATGVLISFYTTVDKSGMRYFDPVTYLYLIFLVAFILLSPVVLRKDRRGSLKDELTLEFTRYAPDGRRLDPRSCLRVMLCSVLGFVAYCLVLAALKLSPASYVAPVREVSVVVGTWIGIRRLGERGSPMRFVSASLIVAGIAVIALSR
jgi:uncharacterized membrane protein